MVRTWAGTSLAATIGAEKNLLDESPGHCRQLVIDQLREQGSVPEVCDMENLETLLRMLRRLRSNRPRKKRKSPGCWKKSRLNCLRKKKKKTRPARFERATNGFVDRYSIRLSYWRLFGFEL